MAQLNICDVNGLDDEHFQQMFGNVIELCPEAAAIVSKRKPFDSAVDLSKAFDKYLDYLNLEGKIKILQSHPDLAGKLAIQGKLTKESTTEQRSAGLDNLTAEQKEIIDSCNQRYKAKFGFPFIICARQNNVQSITEGLQQRYNNSKELEIDIGIIEVKKICKLRIFSIVKDD